MEVLASCYCELGRYAEGIQMFTKTLHAFSLKPGDEHPMEGVIRGHLASALWKAGRIEEADQAYRLALEREEQLLGPDHRDTCITRDNFANFLQQSKGESAAAEPLFRRTLEGRVRVLGNQHPDTLASMANLAESLEENGREQEARSLRQEYFRRMADHDVDLPPLTLRQSALKCYRAGDYVLAEQLYRRLLQKDFKVSDTHVHLARLFVVTGREKEARVEVELAEQYGVQAKPYIAQRIRYLRLVLDLLEGNVPTDLHVLKNELARPDAFMPWELEALLQRLRPRLAAEAYELLEGIAAAINDRTAMDRLRDVSMWPK
jgi:tetratricopeptide (TPR) repeat protein